MNKEQFKAICRKTQEQLKPYLLAKLKKRYEKIWMHKSFIYAEGTVPICLVAHLDTVHKLPPFSIVEEDDKISSPFGIGGDDRCGVYAILQIIQKYNCSVLFCCDEESGGLGALAFTKTSLAKQAEFKYMIELDRKGKTDAVFYDCDNPEFTDMITQFGPWKENYGSFSDISELAPELGCAAVNLSVGYYKQHTSEEYVVPSHVDFCIDNVCKLIEATKDGESYKYIKAKWNYSRYGGYSNYYDYDYSYGYGYNDPAVYIITYEDEHGENNFEAVDAISDFEAVGIYLSSHNTLTYSHIIEVIDEQYYR